MVYIEKGFDDLLFGVRRSIRYHNRRTRFYDRFHKAAAFLSALTGTATIASVLSESPKLLSITFAVFVVIFSTIDLIVGTAQAARLHNDLSRRFFDLEKLIIGIQDRSLESLNTFIASRLNIEADEPPPLKVLDMICHNELMRAMGYDKSQLADIGWFQRLLSPFCDFREHIIHPKY